MLTKDGATVVRVVATTRAGFMQAALEGMFAAAGLNFAKMTEEGQPPATDKERHFSVQSADFTGLLAAFLNEALKAAMANKEAYAGLRLSLITDVKAEGEFLGQANAELPVKIKAVSCQEGGVHKNQLGYWEANIALSVK